MPGKSRSRHKKQKIATGQGLAMTPRNPVAVAARKKHAGPHRKSASALRQLQARKLANLISDDD